MSKTFRFPTTKNLNDRSQVNFRKLFGILFTAFILIIIVIFLLVSISQKASITTTIILVSIPLAMRYVFYKLANV
jgi:hypothetical protein